MAAEAEDPEISGVRVRRPEWVAHVLDDTSGQPQAILLHLPRGERIALSATGTSVWRLIVETGQLGASAAEIAPTLAIEYDAAPSVVEADVVNLINQLLAGEWVERSDAATHALAVESEPV